jgi:hypothetical protein
MLCYVMLMLCYSILCYVIPFYVMLCYVMLFYSIIFYSILLYFTTYFILIYSHNTHQVLVGLHQGVDDLANSFVSVSFYFILVCFYSTH